MRKKKGTIRAKKRGGVKKDKEATASRKNMKKQNKRISKLAKRRKLSQVSRERFASLSEKRQGKAHDRNVKVCRSVEGGIEEFVFFIGVRPDGGSAPRALAARTCRLRPTGGECRKRQ